MQNAIWGLFLLAFAYDYLSYKQEFNLKEGSSNNTYNQTNVKRDEIKPNIPKDKVNFQSKKGKVHVHIQYW